MMAGGGDDGADSFLKELQRKHRDNKSHEKKQKKSSKRKRGGGAPGDDRDDDALHHHHSNSNHKKKGRKPRQNEDDDDDDDDQQQHEHELRNTASVPTTATRKTYNQNPGPAVPLLLSHKYVLAPMVGASELAFRLLCRRYGAQLAYTPMMDARKFAHDPIYRATEFQTCPEDRPLVCHFSANTPEDFADAALAASPFCDAVDLNLGCPQRTAFAGHFGSYLLDAKDRELVCDMVRAASQAADSKPVFCKIRLLDTVEETTELCRQLRDAGASLVAVHARPRATWERTGPGARDGPALLDQVASIKRMVPGIVILANGNVIKWDDVQNNLRSTEADGIMSAEGLLDDPALFLPRYGEKALSSEGGGGDDEKMVTVVRTSVEAKVDEKEEVEHQKKRRKLLKKLRSIERLEKKVAECEREGGVDALDAEQKAKLADKDKVLAKLEKLDHKKESSNKKYEQSSTTDASVPTTETVPLAALSESAQDKLVLAREYLALVRRYPVVLRSVIFHVRRILKDDLTRYQLMQDCLTCPDVCAVGRILDRIALYRADPERFVYDRSKAEEHKLALERQKQQEGRRRLFEERMVRKAKREGRSDRLHYLKIGSAVPTAATLDRLRELPREAALEEWKREHSQHCFAHHLDKPQQSSQQGGGGCVRGRACAFLHVDINRFDERDEVAG